jgi:holo-[acyl-carrier protein] synthase
LKNTAIGIDIMDVSRFKKISFEKHKTFYKKIFIDSEINYCLKYSSPHIHFAGIFAAKEAIIKCLSNPIKISSIKIMWCDDGKPFVEIDQISSKFTISISHTNTTAIAIALRIT